MKNKPKKTGRWRRRSIWTLLILIALGIVLRLTLPLALPAVLRKVAGNFGMTCSYDRLELNLFSGDAGIWGLEFKPKEGGPAILSADYCHGNVSVLNLFRGKLNVWRVEADGVNVDIDRNSDGHIPLLDRFISSTAATAPAPTAKPKDLDLSSPLRVDALRLDHIRVHLHDRGVSPEIDTDLAMDLRLSDLGSPSHPTKFEMNLSADPLLDTMRVTGEGRSSGKSLDAKLNVLVRGIRLKPAAAYLAPLGIRPVSDGITLTAHGQVHTAPAPNNAEGFTASIAFDHLSATADRQEALGLDNLSIDSGLIDTKSIRIERCVLEGARAFAGRAANGNLQIAGIEYDPALVAEKPPTPPSPTSPMLIELMKEKWSVGELAMKHARLDFHDEGISPMVDLSLIADELSATSIDHDPSNLNTAVTLTGRVRAPGLIREIKVDGTATPFADEKKFTVTVNAAGIKLDAVQPYLDRIGIESRLKDGRFIAAATGTLSIGDTITAGAKLTKFEFSDGQPLLALTDLSASKMTLNPITGAINIGDVELTGPGISIVRDSVGRFSAMGFRTKPAVANTPPLSSTPVVMPANKPAAAFSLSSLPHITLQKFGWNRIHLDLQDQSTTPVTNLSVTEIGLEATDLTTDTSAKKQGQFKAWIKSPGNVDRLELNGIAAPLETGIVMNATVQGSGLNAMALTPYLKPIRIEPVLRDGAIKLKAGLNVQQNTSGLSAALTLDDLTFADGSRSLASINHVLVDVNLPRAGETAKDITVRSVEIKAFHIAASREADGSLSACGVRYQPGLPANQDPPAVAVGTPSPKDRQVSPPRTVLLSKLFLSDASIDWEDRAVEPNVKLTAGASLELQNLVWGREAAPARLHLEAYAKGSADHLLVNGQVSAGPAKQQAQLDIKADGLRAGPLAAYLPPGIASSLKAGQFQTSIGAELSPNSQGGLAAELTVGALDFRDDLLNDPRPLFHLDSVHVKAPRIDLPENALAVDEIAVKGLQTHAEKLPDGDFTCMGLVISAKPPELPRDTRDTGLRRLRPVPATQPSPTAANSKSENLNHDPEDRVTGTPLSTTTGPSAKDLLAASRIALPAVTVEKLDLNLASFELTDLSRPTSQPLIVSDLTLHNLDRIDWLGKNPDGKPPTKLQLNCKLSPLVDQVMVDISATPFARQPHLHLDFAATGVHGDGLTKLMPELKDKIDGSGMNDGSLTAHLNVDARLDRRSPLDFDVSQGFDLGVVLNKVQYRGSPDGPVLAGVDEVRGEGIRIVPSQSIVHVKTLEITQPIGRITQDQEGIHALGWTYKLPTGAPSTQPAIAAKTEPENQSPDVRPDAKPVGEMRIDKLLISGLDFTAEDSAFTPPLTIPLNGLDVEVRNLSSLAPFQDKPIRFSALVSAGKVKLPKRGVSPPVMEDRDLFSQVTANGEVSLYPRLHGWAKTSVSGLDLAELQGAAQQFNETLTAGVYDSEVDMRFDPAGSIAITSHFTLTDLSLSEPPNGLIFQVLHLPAPLDVAIGAVEDQDKSITLPLNFTLDPKHISYLDLAAAGTAGVADILVKAIVAAPLKAVSLLGFSGDAPPQDLTTTIAFPPGSAAYGPSESAALSALLKKLLDDPTLNVTLKSQLGSGDLNVLRVRANPTPEQRESLESHLRARKEELLRLRSDAAGRARADLASVGASAAEPALDRLRAIDREIDATDESLEQVGDLLKPGADRLAERRTRAASLKIAHDRLSAIHSALLDAGLLRDRVKMTSAQFNPSDQTQGGQVTIVVVKKK